ncbi:septal ring lytic transglycosylase RlpA family protein [Roseibium algae]|uniref:Endolytic peptidoglycan transglycosylase RlpA n=1 Tax=Roseibium algae TaxID=3123038 RepID=A0ABU8TRT5_9HYPH
MLGMGDLGSSLAARGQGLSVFHKALAGISVKTMRNLLLVSVSAGFLAACGTTPTPTTKAKFSPKKYGVKGSPQMVSASSKTVPKGGGRYVVGKKYKIAGKWYYPKLDPNYKKVGLASWYGPTFHGRQTANGEIFDRGALTAAHTTMPLPSYAKVTNLENGRSMIVRVNDRGPFHGNRVIDLSERVATLLGTKGQGVGKVKVEYVGKARMDGHDEQYLLASYSGPGSVAPGGTVPGTMFAQLEAPVRAPSARPYGAATLVASLPRSSESSYQVAYDPAIAFEASASTIRVASANTFSNPLAVNTGIVATPAAYAEPIRSPEPGVLGVLNVPAPASPRSIVPGSAISSYTAKNRIDGAHSALLAQGQGGVSLRMLATAQSKL